MRNNSLALTIVIAMLVNLVGPALAPLPVVAAPTRDFASLGALPAWFAGAFSVTSGAKVVLPAWFATAPRQPAFGIQCLAPSAQHPTSGALPAWFSPSDQQPAFSPPPRHLLTDIPLSLLTVDVTGPAVASLGSPLGYGKVYTAVIRNSSTYTAYGAYLTATHPVFFVHDGGDQIISRTGVITPFTVVASSTAITWTPVTTYNLLPGEAITLSFKLRATCAAQSGQRLEIGVRYNADPPPATPDELNAAGLNVTTGRGNLVIKKEPALQHLDTSDFGKPITWTITVQNTGLGKLYDAVITDTGGIDLDPPTLTPPTRTIPVLGVNDTVVFTAVGAVAACNFTNVALASWSCGNLVGDATASNPLSSTVSVLFTPEAPNVNVQVSSPITFSYCGPITRTVVVTVSNAGGPAANFRLDSSFESNGFLEVITPSISGDWQYDAGLFSYVGGSPTGTVPAAGLGGPVTLTFQVRPQDYVCTAGGGSITFEPLYNDVCTNEPFTASPVEMVYQYAQGEAPDFNISKSGPAIVAGGEVFTYQVTVSGENADHISGTVNVTDVLPAQFVLLGVITRSVGVTSTNGQTVTWSFDPGSADIFTETLIYQVRAITTTGGACGASLIVANGAEAFALPTCPACSPFNPTAQIETAIENNEGVFSDNSSSGVYEACGDGFTIGNSYLITGSPVVTWTGAVFTEALGTDIGGAGALPSTVPLIYRAGSLSLTINGIDYTAVVTPVTTTGHLVIDLSPLANTTAPTQNVTLLITYTVEISEGSLNGLVGQTFHDWTQLFLPGFSDEGCAGNSSFNQVLVLTISRGDLSVGLEPQILDKCRTNRAIIHVNGGDPTRLTDHVVVTFTSSTAEILSARNFATTGGLPDISQITVMTDSDVGGGRGVITFTFPVTADLDADGTIQFDVAVNCTDQAPWNAGVTFQSRCAFTYGDAASLGHVYRRPNLLLFATPIKYTVREKEVIWKFFVTNNDNLTATGVVVTNTVAGLAVFTYTADGPGVSAILPVTNSDAVFTITQIAPNQQRAVTVTANVIACNPLGVVISATHRCFGVVCNQPTAEVSFDTPDPYLLTNNGETADLPMCDIGEVVFTTKNASADVTLYQLNITETLRGLEPAVGEPITVTIENADGDMVASTTGFTPTRVLSGTSETLLIWKAISATTDVYTWFNALPPLYIVRMFVPVNTSCVPPNSPQSFAQAEAQGPCGKKLGYTEDAVTLQTLSPDMTVLKEGRVAGGDYGETIYAVPGQTVTWRIEVDNRNTGRSYVAHNVVLSDTWPDTFEFITATLGFTPTIVTATRTILWDIGDVHPLDPPLEFLITGSVVMTDDACAAATINRTRLRYGCDFNGCTIAPAPVDTAQLDSGPNIVVELSSDPVPICGGDIPVTVRNYGARAYSATLTVTLPSGYVYISHTSGLPTTGTGGSSGAPTFSWDAIPGHTGAAPYTFALTLSVMNSGSSGACPSADGEPVTATMGYDNHAVCTSPGPFSTTHVVNLDVVSPAFDIEKSPRAQTVNVGDPITWTITLTNTGDTVAENVVINDAVGSNYHSVTATVGTVGYTTLLDVAGNAITWTLAAPVDVNGVWSATVSAVLSATGNNRNVVTATAGCATGCVTAIVSDTAHTTLLQDFEKNPNVQTGTIGSLVVFTFTSSLPDVNALYENLTLTDTLPAGLGYVDSELTYSYDSGAVGPVISATPTITPGWLDYGGVIWRLGDLSGTVQINGVITAVIQEHPASYDGARLINDLRMTYTDDGQDYTHSDTADVDVLEPVLHIGKSYVTPDGCAATLLADNFNFDTGLNPPAIGNWSRINNNVQAAQGALHLWNSGDVGNSAALSDFSLSFMARKNDEDVTGTNPRLFIYFRRQASGDRYNLEWQADGDLRLYRTGGSGTFGGTNSTMDLAPQRWYHFEIRAEQNRIQVYVDGQQIFDDTDANFSSGTTQIRTNAGSDFDVDDVLVTRFGQTGCFVRPNDVATYTLVISNQARLPGYDLVVTDSLPAGMSLITYTMESDDPDPGGTTGPSSGDTGALVWSISRLTATSPFSPLNHTALTLTVVLTVSSDITSNIVLPNQASLVYDNWESNGEPMGVDRDASGGSHSTAVQTPDGRIGDYVWVDLDRDGIQDAGETPIPGVMIDLYNSTTGAYVTSTTTNGSGLYLFDDLSLNVTYTVQLSQVNFTPSGALYPYTYTLYLGGAPFDNSDSNANPDASFNGAGYAVTTTLTSAITQDLTLDFGFYAGLIGDYVWVDYDRDGLQDAGETPIPGVVVDLYNSTTGAFITSTTTSGGGLYLFDDLLLHVTYTVQLSQVNFAPGGALYPYTHTVYGGAPFDNSDSNADPDASFNGAGYAVTTTLTSAITQDLTLDFGFHAGRIGDYVWVDLDRDGAQDGGETPISGVVVDLYDSGSGAFITSTTTNGGGLYLFDDLLLNVTYTVQLSQVNFAPGGALYPYTHTVYGGAPFNNSDSNANPDASFNGAGYAVTTTLTSAITEDLTLDFGFHRGRIGDYVWIDVDLDGVQNDGTAIPGVVIDLYDSASGAFITTTTTDGSGLYLFDDLPLNVTYTVQLSQVNFTSSGALYHYTPTLVHVGSSAADSDADFGAQFNGVGYAVTTTLTSAITENLTLDFGFFASGRIGDYVWVDLNRDGVQNDGTAIPGVVIDLYDSGSGAFITSTTTDGSGLYLFDDLDLNVTYTVQLSQVNFALGGALYPYTHTLYAGTPFDNTDSNATPDALFNGAGYAVTTTLTWAITEDLTLDFGFYAGRIGDYVWVDLDRDGAQDGGETPIPGVIVYLYNSSTGAYLGSDTTDGSGLYLFDDLPLNVTYTVQLSQVNFTPGGALYPYTHTVYDGAPFDNSDSNANPDALFNAAGYAVTTTLTSVITEDLTLDFGFYRGRIGDYVWLELVRDGEQNGLFENPIPGVVVDLYDSTSGAYLTSDTTDGSGRYLFDDLPLNVTYTVQLSQVNFAPGGPLYPYTHTLYLGGGAFVITDSNATPDDFFNGFGYAVTTTLTSAITENLTLDFGFYAEPDLELVKTVAPGAAARSMPFTYSIRIENTGQVTFTAMRLTDTLPSADFHYVSSTGVPTDPDTIAEPLLVWDDLVPVVGELAPGDSVTVTFAVTATPTISGAYWNTATVRVTTTPGDVLTDTAAAPVDIRDPAVEINKGIGGIDRGEAAPNYVTFTIAITNVGPSVIDVLPLVDQYDPYYLSFEDATPYPEQDADDGSLTWNDLTGPAPNGFGRNLPPGEPFLVTTIFRIVHEINVTTTNIVTTTNVIDDYDNPASDDDDEEEIGGEEGDDDTPTPVEIVYFRAVEEEAAVRLEWATAAELNLEGFHVYRAVSANFDDAQTIAYVPATGPGSEYSHADRDATPGQPYWYWLVEEVGAGAPDTYGPVQGGVGIDWLPYRLYLPLVLSSVEGLIQRGPGGQSAAPSDCAQDRPAPHWADWLFGHWLTLRVGLLPESRRTWRNDALW